MSSVVRISSAGEIEGLYDDTLAEVLREYGEFEVRRAARIEYDNVLKGWLVEVVEYDGFFIGPFRTKAVADVWEEAYLNSRLGGEDDPAASQVAIHAVTNLEGKH